MLYILIFIATIAITLVAGKINLFIQFNNQVKELFAQSKNVSNKKFNHLQLPQLPEPVQRYFKHVLKDGQPYINYVRLKHDGKFKSDLKKEWVEIKGEQNFTTEKPGYIWKGKTAMFVARDMYIAGKGRLIATILSLINMVDLQGEQYDQGELLRWLAESVWLPTNLLPSKNLQWAAVDNETATLSFEYNGLSLFYIVNFNSLGEIAQMETQRYMDETRLETWVCKMSSYEEISGMLIPTRAEALWRLEEGDFSYAKFNVRTIEYNKPEIF